jgi:hypothetical protein
MLDKRSAEPTPKAQQRLLSMSKFTTSPKEQPKSGILRFIRVIVLNPLSDKGGEDDRFI